MGIYDWAAVCSIECIQSDGFKDVIRVHCYWKCNGWRYSMSPVYGYVYKAGDSEICVANGISVDFQNNQGQYELGYNDYVINRGQSNIHTIFGAHIVSKSSYVSGDKWSNECSYDTGALSSYTITYNANGGNGAPGNQTRWYGSSINLSDIRPTRDGYTFLGWATSPSGGVAYQPGQSYSGDYNLNLYAVWQVNTWIVYYNANGGINAPASQIKIYGQTLKLSSNKPTKVDYNFLGWATSKTDADAGKVTYAAGANYVANSNVILYAVWELAYVRPRITNLSITRCDSAGNNSESGTYLRIDFNWATDMTAAVAKLQYKLQTATSWTEETIFSNNDNKSGSVIKKVLASNKINTESSYIARIYMYDSKGATDTNYRTYSSEFSISTLAYPIDVRKGGKGIAFGKVAETDDLADFDFDVQFRKDIKLRTPGGTKNFLDAVYPIGSIYMSVKSTDPSLLFGGTWARWGSGRIPVGIDTNDSDFNTVEKTGGEKSVTLKASELPNHNHLFYNDFNGYVYPTVDKGHSTTWGASFVDSGDYKIGPAEKQTMEGTFGESHNNLQPYIVCYMWKRTA